MSIINQQAQSIPEETTTQRLVVNFEENEIKDLEKRIKNIPKNQASVAWIVDFPILLKDDDGKSSAVMLKFFKCLINLKIVAVYSPQCLQCDFPTFWAFLKSIQKKNLSNILLVLPNYNRMMDVILDQTIYGVEDFLSIFKKIPDIYFWQLQGEQLQLSGCNSLISKAVKSISWEGTSCSSEFILSLPICFPKVKQVYITEGNTSNVCIDVSNFLALRHINLLRIDGARLTCSSDEIIKVLREFFFQNCTLDNSEQKYEDIYEFFLKLFRQYCKNKHGKLICFKKDGEVYIKLSHNTNSSDDSDSSDGSDSSYNSKG